MPDFNRDKTLYQVNFAKKKEYVPHKCATLKSMNLCMATKANDALCLEGYFSKKNNEQRKISHPLFYVRYKQFVNSLKTKKPIKTDLTIKNE